MYERAIDLGYNGTGYEQGGLAREITACPPALGVEGITTFHFPGYVTCIANHRQSCLP
jgi:hypothetical protein